MFLLLPEIWLWEAKDIEVIRDGRKKIMTDARMKIVMDAGFITDYDGDFEKTKGLKKVEGFLNGKILYHEHFLKYFDYLDYYLYGYMQDTKKYLEMETATNAY